MVCAPPRIAIHWCPINKSSLEPASTVQEVLTDEKIDLLRQAIEDIKAIGSKLNIIGIALNIDFE